MQDDHEPVRRPVRPNTDLVRLTLDHLAEAGVTWAPRFVEIDGGFEVLSWFPGQTADGWWDRPLPVDELTRVVRQLHDETSGLSGAQECLVHDDLQPRNVVVDGDRVGLIDWEQLRPGRRVEDVSQLCWSFTGVGSDADVESVGRRWRRVLDVYGLVDRSEVIPVAMAKIDRCIADIVRESNLGSVRHQRLEERGDHHELGQMHSWLEANQTRLVDLINRRTLER